MVMLDVEGAPATTNSVPTVVPSRVKVMVPVGEMEEPPGAVMVAEMRSVPPATGESVAG